MKLTYRRLSFGLAVSALVVPTLSVADGVEYHGYMRAQVGGTSKGGNLQCFQGDWPVRAKYRLGNECDNYGEASIGVPFGDPDKAWAKYHLTVSLKEKGAQDYESTKDGTYEIANRENYIETGGVFGAGALENARLWVGKRYYNRHDIHMNDYYYWGNSGAGGGIEEIGAGPAKLSFAYFQNGGNANAAKDLVGKRLSMRFYDINANENGKFEGELVLLKGSTAGDAEKGRGTQLFLKHSQSGVLGGFNHVALVLGNKLGNGFEWLPTYQGAAPTTGNSWRIHDHLHFSLKGTPWTGTATASYGKSEGSNGNDNTWASIGIRPVYAFSENWSLATEAGYDQGESDSGKKPKLAKLTVAPQVTLSSGVWARPVLRAFATYAKWNADAGNIANGVFGEKRNGLTYGLQAEVWF